MLSHKNPKLKFQRSSSIFDHICCFPSHLRHLILLRISRQVYYWYRKHRQRSKFCHHGFCFCDQVMVTCQCLLKANGFVVFTRKHERSFSVEGKPKPISQRCVVYICLESTLAFYMRSLNILSISISNCDWCQLLNFQKIPDEVA